MRLIDADALIDELDSVIICENFDAERMIRDMPTVDVLEEIRAEIEQLRIHKAEYLTSDNKVCIDSQAVLDIIDKYRG